MCWAPGEVPDPARVLEMFLWPEVSQDVVRFCQTCPSCQVATRRGPAKAPLSPLPVVDTPFERIVMDFGGPLPRSSWGFRYMLVIIDYSTTYPEVVLLQGMQVQGVAQALLKFFLRVGLPCEILTDKGATFTLPLLKQLYQMIGIHQLFTTIYHPQTDGLVKRMNQTIKVLLRKTVGTFPTQWDKYLDPLLFALRETPQASAGIASFELVLGSHP